MKIKEITHHLESIAPLSFQEGYDNSGLIVGDKEAEVTGILVCLDSTEIIVEEAIEKGCNLIVAHHPIVFGGLKKLTGKNYVERTVINAIKNDIAIYAIHTNLDNVIAGVNGKIAEKLGLKNTKVLSPKNQLLKKLVTYVPIEAKSKVQDALFNAGAGHIGNYSECSYSSNGEGSYLANDKANPYKGDKTKRHFEPEVKVEVVYSIDKEPRLVASLIKAHPYEEVAYDLINLTNVSDQIGAGIIGDLEEPIDSLLFLKDLKVKMNTNCVRHTQLTTNEVKKVAICGGAGSFLLRDAIAQQADIFITGDFKYHEFFDADNQIIIADIGHFESEQFTIELLVSILKEKFTTFAVRLTEKETNPIHYL
jgi:dinuclear metal center YbgI/SA1388 family protein